MTDTTQPTLEEGAIMISEAEAVLLARVHGAKTKDLKIVRQAMGHLWVTGYDKRTLRLLERFRAWRTGKR